MKPGGAAGERRIDRGALSVCMSEVNGWVMVRRPRCVPYVMASSDWRALPFEKEPD